MRSAFLHGAMLTALFLAGAKASAQDAWMSLPDALPAEVKTVPTSSPVVTLGAPVATLGRPVLRRKHSSPSSPSLLPAGYQTSARDVSATIRLTQAQEMVIDEQAPRASMFAVDRSLSLPVAAGGSESAEAPALSTAEKLHAPLPSGGSWGTGWGPGVAGPPLSTTPHSSAGIVGAMPTSRPGDAPAQRFYAGVSYLLWNIKKDDVPVLASTGDQAGFGFLGNANTQVLFAGPLDRNWQSGGRFTFGVWLDDCQSVGVETSWFYLGERSDGFFAGSNQFPVLTRPVFLLNTGAEFGENVAFPGVGAGTLSIDAPSSLWGGELNLRCASCSQRSDRLSMLAGFRFLNLSEGLFITERINPFVTIPGTDIQAQSTAIVQDGFQTHNQFYGPQVGFNAGWDWGRWSLNVNGKVAVGVTRSRVKINGSQTFFNPNGTVVRREGGLLAVAGTNIGEHRDSNFAVVPEVGVNLGYQLTPGIRLSAGYSFLYWSSVLRPGSEVDRVVDGALVPNLLPAGTPATGIARPAPQLNDVGFWAQGVNFTLEFRY